MKKSINLLLAQRIISEVEELNAKKEFIGKSFNLSKIIKHITQITKFETRENFFILCISPNDKILHFERVARGSLDEVGVYIRDLMIIALSYPTKKLVVFHNHPGVPCEVSRSDLILYQELLEIMRKVDILLLDSYVVGDNGVSSSKRRNKIKPKKFFT